IGTQKSGIIPVPTAITEFHTYAIEWYEDRIEFYIDDIFYFTFNNENCCYKEWPFDKRFHLILNIAVGGSWGGVQGIDQNAFPATMEIDYVRVYERTE
ncbi:MAG: glycoside hydrolase family 16 protein, partial [Melioribacteraceae bacterium]|nr:glycoside hydrolase family 16 protein [Melioribacteraceae bacterium]